MAPRPFPVFEQFCPVQTSLDLISADVDVQHVSGGRRNRQTLGSEQRDVLLNRFFDEARHFLARCAHGDTPRQIWHRSAETRGPVFDEDGVLHRCLRSQSSPACR